MPPFKMTVGFLNRNPGNLRYFGVTWNGLAASPEGPCDDKGFCVFTNDLDGIRALALDLLNAQRRHGLRTIAEIIPHYAPAKDNNNVVAYIADVAHDMGVPSTHALDLTDASQLAALVSAVIKHENGADPYSDDLKAAAVAAAYAA